MSKFNEMFLSGKYVVANRTNQIEDSRYIRMLEVDGNYAYCVAIANLDDPSEVTYMSATFTKDRDAWVSVIDNNGLNEMLTINDTPTPAEREKLYAFEDRGEPHINKAIEELGVTSAHEINSNYFDWTFSRNVKWRAIGVAADWDYEFDEPDVFFAVIIDESGKRRMGWVDAGDLKRKQPATGTTETACESNVEDFKRLLFINNSGVHLVHDIITAGAKYYTLVSMLGNDINIRTLKHEELTSELAKSTVIQQSNLFEGGDAQRIQSFFDLLDFEYDGVIGKLQLTANKHLVFVPNMVENRVLIITLDTLKTLTLV